MPPASAPSVIVLGAERPGVVVGRVAGDGDAVAGGLLATAEGAVLRGDLLGERAVEEAVDVRARPTQSRPDGRPGVESVSDRCCRVGGVRSDDPHDASVDAASSLDEPHDAVTAATPSISTRGRMANGMRWDPSGPAWGAPHSTLADAPVLSL